MDDDARLETLSAAAARHPGMQVLVLHGSRARGEAHARSDWDLAALGSDDLDPGALHVTAVSVLGTNAVDLVDLERASALLRFRAARDGRCLFEDQPGRHRDFVLAATHFWCDAGPIIRRAQRAVLADLRSPTGRLDPEVLAERTAAVQRHLARVEQRLPADPDDLSPASDATDTVVLHLWQAVQVVIDLAVSACVALGLGSPPTYASAFRLLGDHGVIDRDLAERLARAAGLRNLIVHRDADLDLRRVHAAATHGPDDLRALLAALRDRSEAEPG